MGKTFKLDMAKVVCDTRENKPLWTTGVRKALATGDYSYEGYEDQITVERKGPQDVFGSIGAGRRRFWRGVRRLARYNHQGGFGGLVVETTRQGILKFPRRGRVHPNQALGTLERCQVEYNIPVAYAEGRVEARMIVKTWLRMAVEKVEGMTLHSLDDICPCGQGGPVKEHDRRRKLFGCHGK